MEQLRQAGYGIHVMKDLSDTARERLQEVSQAKAQDCQPRGVMTALTRAVLNETVQGGYLTVEEVEAALVQLSQQYPQVVTLLPLPNKTWEGRTSHAVLLRAGTANPGTNQERPGFLITGSMHAREWGGSDICIHFLTELLRAYHQHTPLTYGGKSFTDMEVKTIMETLDLFVFPDVNPDGKHYSQTNDPQGGHSANQGFWWRKNRRSNGVREPMGVDINRNFDFLWDSGIGSSAEFPSDTYRGPRAFSEPETKNVKYLMDTYPNIQFYVDIHSYGGMILYSWGDDDNQSINPGQNFRNPAYRQVRGKTDPARKNLYREYISALDERMEVKLAQRMNRALQAVRGKSYEVKQAVGLYPTSATSEDYAYSRHIVDPSKKKIYGFTIEFGQYNGEFVPPYDEMKEIIKDVGAALTELGLAAATMNPTIRNAGRTDAPVSV
ncbi:M14 family metallopeptidase [Brevibacillus dissolubilis]|uniref:M14 family metallopeptidase n=1 Tax=Brevibacillus dissolubilis TaxID=1844116 RepID=UPI00210012F4|nr:M14 family metallopeptidase [Brevibacillus dissolubilis]